MQNHRNTYTMWAPFATETYRVISFFFKLAQHEI